jgi:hypothetical protein
MKTRFNPKAARQHRQGGLAVILVLALLSVVLVCIASNLKTLYRLDREVKLVEHQQLRRLNVISAANAAALNLRPAETNAPAAATNSPALPAGE